MRDYYYLTKPGIIYGNGLAAAAGFLLASEGAINVLFLATLFGISFVIASGCVFNNYLDRDIDARMERTKKRALVRGTVSERSALVFGTILLLLGTGILFFGTTLAAALVAMSGWFVYVVIYSRWSKRYTMHATVLGAIAGAVPPVVGYAAVTGELDVAAGILFLILMFWQMPHALAIAIYRYSDYAAANIPVLPLTLGMFSTKVVMVLCASGFTAAVLSLSAFGYTGFTYAIVLGALCVAWSLMSFRGFTAKDDAAWAKRVFRFSLILMLAFCLMIAFEPLLP